MFQRVNGSDRGTLKRDVASGTTVTKGQYYDYSATTGYATIGTATSEMDQRCGIAAETKTTTATDLGVLFQKPVAGDLYVIDTLNNTDAAHNYQRMIWGTASCANNTGTDVTGDTGILRQICPLGATGDKKILAELTFTPGD